MLSAHPSNSHLKHNPFAGMCRWRAQQTFRCGRVTVIEFGTSKRRAAARSWHVNNAAECSVWRGKKTGQSPQRNVGNRSETVREQVSDVSIPGSSLLPLASSLRHRSASSFNATLRDDESSGGGGGGMRAEFTGRHVEAVLNYPASCPFSSISSSLRHQRRISYWRNLLGRNGNLDFAEQSLSSLTAGWSGVNRPRLKL